MSMNNDVLRKKVSRLALTKEQFRWPVSEEWCLKQRTYCGKATQLTVWDNSHLGLSQYRCFHLECDHCVSLSQESWAMSIVLDVSSWPVTSIDDHEFKFMKTKGILRHRYDPYVAIKIGKDDLVALSQTRLRGQGTKMPPHMLVRFIEGLLRERWNLIADRGRMGKYGYYEKIVYSQPRVILINESMEDALTKLEQRGYHFHSSVTSIANIWFLCLEDNPPKDIIQEILDTKMLDILWMEGKKLDAWW